MRSSVLAPAEVEYPSEDGKPVAESDFQLNVLIYARERLRIWFRDDCKRDDVYVAGNLMIFYEEGNTGVWVAPDVFAVFGVSRHDRSSYLLWREGKAPDFVLEITSRTTRGEDQGRKRELYRWLKVQEYWQYDPTGDYLSPRLQGQRLTGGEYVRMAEQERAHGLLALSSEVLGLELHATADGLRYYDPVTDTYLLSHADSEAGRRAAEAGLAEEAAARRAAEARIAELEARLRGRGGALEQQDSAD